MNKLQQKIQCLFKHIFEIPQKTKSAIKRKQQKHKMFRTFHKMPKFNVIVVLVAIGLLLCYFAFIFQFLILLNATFKFIVIPISIVLFTLLYWVFLKVYLTDPGNVPTFWTVQYHQETKCLQRRYCLQCHNFKPQRTHHCSACGKCILNMDHHCPFLNNCVGFYNRKFFVLFLFYLIANLIFVLPQELYLLVLQLIPIFNQEASANIHTCIRLIFIIFEIGLIFPIISFTAYHYTLIFRNETTLSQLKRQRQQINGKVEQQVNIYDIGTYNNFVQVFGKRKWQWFLPITGTLTCDGLNWPKNGFYWDLHYSQSNTQRYQKIPEKLKNQF